MSDACAGSSTDWLQRFDSVWHVDFEFRQDANHRPVPVCMFACEQHTGTNLAVARPTAGLAPGTVRHRPARSDGGLRRERRAVVLCRAGLAVSVQRARSCMWRRSPPLTAALDIWPPLDPLTANRRKRSQPGLLAALELHGLPGMAAAEKDRMRDLILDHTDYSNEQRRDIQDYNRVDVEETVALLSAMAPGIDLPRALHRGRFMAAIAREERIGLPIDRDAWRALSRTGIACSCTTSRATMISGSMMEIISANSRLEDLIAARGWDWPRTTSGRLELSTKGAGPAGAPLSRTQASSCICATRSRSCASASSPTRSAPMASAAAR